MACKFSDLPPSKRYRLLQEQENQTPTPSPSCLPAKKRKEARNFPVLPPSSSTFCLPAKKRIWALHEFDLNLEFQPQSESEKKPEEDKPKEEEIQNPPVKTLGEESHDEEGKIQIPMEKAREESKDVANEEEKIQISMAKQLREDVSNEEQKIQKYSTAKRLREQSEDDEEGKIQIPMAKSREQSKDLGYKEEKMIQKSMAERLREQSEDEGTEEEDDDGILCAICESTDGDPSDPIVFCDGCELMVHASCYGHPLANGVPEGDWFCAECQSSRPSLKCSLCPVLGGALKPTTEAGKWAHVVCALFVPEVFFRDPEGREGIDMSQVPNRRYKHRCYICKSRNGCSIDCSEERCPLAFHVTCGIKKDLCIEYKEGRNKTDVVAGFCRTHSDLWRKQQKSGKYKIVPEKQ